MRTNKKENYLFQKPLPKLPVPDLKCTLDTYLTIMKSVLTTEELNRTQIIVEDFGRPGGTGEMLQEKLKKVAETKDNWVNTMLKSNSKTLSISSSVLFVRLQDL